MLEVLLVTSCYFSNYQACYQASSAYYNYSGIEQQVNNYSQKIEKKINPNAKAAIAVGYMAVTQRIDTSAAINDYSRITLNVTSDIFKLGYVYEF